MKLNLSNITSGYGAVAALNANFDAIEAAVEKTLSRDGTTPNEMLANLDMNGNDILNANAVDVSSLTINGTPVQPATGVTVASAFQSYTFTATLGQTSFSVSPYTPYVASVQVEVNGLSLPPADITVSGTNVVIPACSAGDEVVIRRYTDAPSPFPVADDITFTPAGTINTRSVQSKLRDVVSVKDFGAVGNGIVDDTLAFTAARTASSGRYYVPDGTYLVASSPDVWADNFTASGAAYIKIGATTYNISNAFAGRLRYQVASNVLTNIVDAVTGNIIVGYQNSAAGTATYFYRGLAFKTDSHWCQVKPATNGGSTDLLWQRSDVNADPNGNRFNETFEEANDRLIFSFATTASGAPAFDSFMVAGAGTSPYLTFPGLRPQFNQGISVKQRAAGGYEFGIEQSSSTQAKFKQIGGSGTTYMLFRDGAFGFFGSSGTSQQTVTGSKGGNAALASLITALANTGLIVDGTT